MTITREQRINVITYFVNLGYDPTKAPEMAQYYLGYKAVLEKQGYRERVAGRQAKAATMETYQEWANAIEIAENV